MQQAISRTSAATGRALFNAITALQLLQLLFSKLYQASPNFATCRKELEKARSCLKSAVGNLRSDSCGIILEMTCLAGEAWPPKSRHARKEKADSIISFCLDCREILDEDFYSMPKNLGLNLNLVKLEMNQS